MQNCQISKFNIAAKNEKKPLNQIKKIGISKAELNKNQHTISGHNV
jgi:hypothetical protein